jgi:hypothetical protein
MARGRFGADQTDVVDDRPHHRVDIDRGVHHWLVS